MQHDEADVTDVDLQQRSKKRRHSLEQDFTCRHCHRLIGLPISGGQHRNHCPFCLYSLHVDAQHSGDRLQVCRSLMQPIGAFQRPSGEHVIVHQCLGCGFERHNRIAADDMFALVLALPVVPARIQRKWEPVTTDSVRIPTFAEEQNQPEATPLLIDNIR